MALSDALRALAARARADPRRRQLAGARDAGGRARRAALRRAAARARTLEDVDGNRYVDWVMSWGPLIFGHADPEMVEAVREAARARHDASARRPRREVELAAEIVDAVPSVEKVRLVSSGTEAAMSAIRLARGVTRRDRILKFAGCYHGHADALLAEAGSGLATLGIPSSPACRRRVDGRHDRRARTTTSTRSPPRSRATARGSRRSSSSRSPGTWASSRPSRASSRRCARSATRAGALLVFDEVITGFRVARGGAQERYGVLPDLTILGKIVGGGLPLAAFGGRADVMERARAGRRRLPGRHALREPARDGRRALRAAPAARPGRLRASSSGAARGSRRGLRAVRRACSASARWLTLFCRDGAVRDFDDAQRCDTERYGALFRHLLERGVYVAPSQFEALFVSLAHGDEEIDRTVEAVARLLRRLTSGTTIARRAPPRESPLWARRCARRRARARAGLLAARPTERFALGARDDLRGLPLHYGRPRLFAPADARHGAPARRLPLRARARPDRGARRRRRPSRDLAELISLCAQLRADGRDGDGAAWAATAALLGSGDAGEARAALRDDGDPAPLERARARGRRATRPSSARSPRTPRGSVRVAPDAGLSSLRRRRRRRRPGRHPRRC